MSAPEAATIKTKTKEILKQLFIFASFSSNR
jgi:hypothetical protein